MSTKQTILVSEAVQEKTPGILRNLPNGQYRLTKLRAKENPVHGVSRIPEGRPYTGEIQVFNRGGGPALVIGGYPFGGMMTSWVMDAQPTAEEGQIAITTENSHYLLEGPLAEAEERDESDDEAKKETA